MDFNSFVFPVPKTSYSITDYPENIVLIPRKKDFSFSEMLKFNKNNKSKNSPKNSSFLNKTKSLSFTFPNKFQKLTSDTTIPCLFLPEQDSHHLLLFFHANYEDIGNTYQLMTYLRQYLKLNILAVEYPGYGIYKASSPSAEIIIEDSEIIYGFLTNVMGIDESALIVMGRCIGSGPAVHLASKYAPGGLILMSAFTCLKEAVDNISSKILGGLSSLVSGLFKDRFRNVDLIGEVDCVVCIIHGKEDEVIPWEHSLNLFKLCKCPAKLVTPSGMTHGSFKLFRDLINPLKDYMTLFNFHQIRDDMSTVCSEDEESFWLVKFPDFMFKEINIC